MDLMHKNRIPFGVSICYTSKNYRVVTSDEFLDLLISKGCYFAWYFHYMPVGMGAATDLLLTPEQRAYMKDRVREIRGLTGGKGRSSPSTSRTTASSRTAASPAASSTATSTPRATSSPASSSTTPARTSAKKSFLECLRQPLFLEYRRGQPFNDNLLRPCPMLENPERLPEMVKRAGAHSTDLEAPESAEHLCDKVPCLRRVLEAGG